jgi:hypothetical protein
MEMQILNDSVGPLFTVTDLFRGACYLVAERGAQYEVEVHRKTGYAKVSVPREADVIQVVDQLVWLLDNATTSKYELEVTSTCDFLDQAKANRHCSESLH